MDELDRMYRRLVHNIRAGFPDLLTQPFEVATLHQHLVPYRLNRRELGLDSAEDYELTLTRLLAGTRGLLTGDEEMQSALRAELESPNPDLSAFRAFATSRVALAPDAVHALDSTPSPRPSAEPARPVEARKAEMAGRATVEVTASSTVSPRPQPAPVDRTAPAQRAKPGRATPHGCRYCGGELPEGRDVQFCPHCGQNLLVKQCPACSTELEVDWQYCITCGRQVE
jgi:hypothetical protein